MSGHRGGTGTNAKIGLLHKWTFSKDEMKLSASQQDGMSADDELHHRQQAASFIQEMVEDLNNIKDQRSKITQLGMCVANVHMHRFFYWHSFKRFDYKDVAAACLFLSGKSEESPRKLSHILAVWREKKVHKNFSSDDQKREAAQFLVTLESCILQTIAFDLNVDLPHQHVIKIMESFEKNGHRKKITACAYYFATDVLCVMDWAIRYSCKAIAVAVVHLVAIFADFKMESLFPECKTWYTQFDAEMTEEQLIEMEEEFMRVYNSCSHLHYASKITELQQQQKRNQRRKEDSGKRENDRSNGRNEPEKRARIGPLSANFVSQTNNCLTQKNNQNYNRKLSPTSKRGDSSVVTGHKIDLEDGELQ